MPILMCPPTHFGWSTRSNPWMHVASPVDPGGPRTSGRLLRATYSDLGAEVVARRPRARASRHGLHGQRRGWSGVTGWCSADSASGEAGEASATPAGASFSAAPAALTRPRHTRRHPPSRVPGMPSSSETSLVCGYGFRSDRAAIPGRQGTRCRRGRAGAGRPALTTTSTPASAPSTPAPSSSYRRPSPPPRRERCGASPGGSSRSPTASPPLRLQRHGDRRRGRLIGGHRGG